jgi:hypothetical protein
MKPLERELATLRGLSGCRGDDDRIAEAEAELARLRKIEQAAELACGLLEMCGGRDRPDPIERMRLFCAQAMSGQDWFDVEPFFGDIVAGNACLAAKQARPLADWHEEVGVVLWWRFPVEEPPYCGSPHYDDWPGYHTHWTPLIVPYDPE